MLVACHMGHVESVSGSVPWHVSAYGGQPVRCMPWRSFNAQGGPQPKHRAREAALRMCGCRQPRAQCPGVPLWAQQVSPEGAQSFVVASFPSFWRVYAALAPCERVHYDLVRPNQAVKLIADLDCAADTLTRSQWAATCALFARLVRHCVRIAFGLVWGDEEEGDDDDDHGDDDDDDHDAVVDAVCAKPQQHAGQLHQCPLQLQSWDRTALTATRPKHSCHLVWNLPGNAMFATMEHEKRFMAWVLHTVATKRSWTRRWYRVVPHVSGAPATMAPFATCDPCVYREGAFRLYGSTKLGQARPLLPCDADPDQSRLCASTFWASLAHYVDQASAATERLVLRFGHEPVPDADHGLLLRQRQGATAALASPPPPRMRGVCERVCAFIRRECGARITRFGVRGACNLAPGAPAAERSAGPWLWVGTTSRMCEMRARQHRANKVYFVVDLGLGSYCQKCHDVVDCHDRSWSGSVNPLPEAVWFGAPRGTPLAPQWIITRLSAATSWAGFTATLSSGAFLCCACVYRCHWSYACLAWCCGDWVAYGSSARSSQQGDERGRDKVVLVFQFVVLPKESASGARMRVLAWDSQRCSLRLLPVEGLREPATQRATREEWARACAAYGRWCREQRAKSDARKQRRLAQARRQRHRLVPQRHKRAPAWDRMEEENPNCVQRRRM